VEENKRGIINGATLMLFRNTITGTQYDEILEVVALADANLFKPYLYLIPFEKVRDKLQPVPVSKRAHPLSREYIIESLLSNEFEPVEVNQ